MKKSSTVLFLGYVLCFISGAFAETNIAGIGVTKWTCPKADELQLNKVTGGYMPVGYLQSNEGAQLTLSLERIVQQSYLPPIKPSSIKFLNMSYGSQNGADLFCVYEVTYPKNLSYEPSLKSNWYKWFTWATPPGVSGPRGPAYQRFMQQAFSSSDPFSHFKFYMQTKIGTHCVQNDSDVECHSKVFIKNPPIDKYIIRNQRTHNCLIATGSMDMKYAANYYQQVGASTNNIVTAPVVMAYNEKQNTTPCNQLERAQWVLASGTLQYGKVQLQNVATKGILYQMGNYKIWPPGQEAWKQKGVVTLSTNPVVVTVNPAVISNIKFTPRSYWYLVGTGTGDNQYHIGSDSEGQLAKDPGLKAHIIKEIGDQMYDNLEKGKTSTPSFFTTYKSKQPSEMQNKYNQLTTAENRAKFFKSNWQQSYGEYVYSQEQNKEQSPLEIGLVMMDTELPVTTAYETGAAGNYINGLVANVLEQVQQDSQIKQLCYGSNPCTAVISDWPSIAALEGDFTVPLLLSQSWQLQKVN